MVTNEKEIIHKELAYRVIGLAMEVHRELGHGFLEKVYENALILMIKAIIFSFFAFNQHGEHPEAR